MSNHLAFATVTETLRGLVHAVVKDLISGSNPAATAERPELVKKDAIGVNVFLYQITPNPAWRNADLPTRRPEDGSVAQRPVAAFDLHYLLTFHGVETEFQPQRLLGAVVRVLHAQPVLSRKMIHDAVLISEPDRLKGSNLAEQVELVRFAPLGLSLEELSKLWSVFFQVPYRLSLAYQASVVLVDEEITPQPASPVRVRNLYVVPFKQPEIDEIVPAAGRGQPILPGDTIVISGRNLRGEVTLVRIAGLEVPPDADKIRDDEIRVVLPAALHAGVLAAQVVHRLLMGTPATPHTGVESNVAPFVLRPKVKSTTITTPPDADDIRTVTVVVDPKVTVEQRIVLLLNERGATKPQAFSGVAEKRTIETDTVNFKLGGLSPLREFLVRVQVDGAESLLEIENGAYAKPFAVVPNP